ncbi:MAG: hypothetical protein BroJett042_24850 [Bacteroidota bacterium]|nr:MAG: hypothetical protein BroJett042_24850 [Bacteroidota bacterium]
MGKREHKEKRDVKYQVAFGKRVKELREKLAWAQSDLAAISSVSEAQISAIENGHESPQLHTLKSIALAFGITPSKLLDFPYDFKFNTNLKRGKIRKSGVTRNIKKLLDEGFFRSPRSVSDVIEKCEEEFNIKLRSAETSGVLLLLVNGKTLRKIRPGKSKNLYQEK